MPAAAPSATDVSRARDRLDGWVRELMQWHFTPETGLPVLAGVGRQAGLGSARKEIAASTISTSSAPSRTSGSAAAPCGAGCRRAYAGRPVYVFETGGSTGVPKSRINIDDFRIDYELFSETLPEQRSRKAPTG